MIFSNDFENTQLNRKKFMILCFGVILMFFTSMSKMLAPGPIYDFLLDELALTPAQIGGLGAAFMYSEALSQILIGIYSNRYGGVRILLIGGTMFSIGMIGFPLCSQIWLLDIFRAMTGFGAGVVFIGNAKLLADLFPIRFAMMLGIVLFVSYLGPVTGTVPLVWLIAKCGWRITLFLPGLIASLILTAIAVLSKGTIKKTVPGQDFTMLFSILKMRPMWILSIASALVFGIHYLLLTQVGQKCFQDFYHWEPYYASACITILALIVACNNILVSFLLKITNGRTKPVILFGMISLLLGTASCYFAFCMHLPSFFLCAGFILTAIPAGFFTLYSLVAKEINPPGNTGLAVALVNFAAYVFIALYNNISGLILNRWKEKMLGNIFPRGAYEELFLFLGISSLIALILAFFIPDVIQKTKVFRRP